MAPFRDVILVTSARDERGLEHMVSLVEGELETRTRWASFKPALLNETGWAPFTPPPSLHERFRRLEVTNLSATYGQQKELLEKKFEKEGQDIFVASYSAMEKDGRVKTWAAWTQGVSHALLPVTDVIIFAAPGDESVAPLVVPTEVAREVVGHLMLATDLEPTRFRTHEFPSADELARLQAASAVGS